MLCVIKNTHKQSLTFASSLPNSTVIFTSIQVHYHIIPAPQFNTPQPKEAKDHVTLALTQKEMHQKEFESRDELDDDDATTLVNKIRARL